MRKITKVCHNIKLINEVISLQNITYTLNRITPPITKWHILSWFAFIMIQTNNHSKGSGYKFIQICQYQFKSINIVNVNNHNRTNPSNIQKGWHSNGRYSTGSCMQTAKYLPFFPFLIYHNRTSFINSHPDGIPNNRYILPFINKPWSSASYFQG